MILAAGRGERMKPLTDVTPKPLLKVAGKPLIEYHLMQLAKLGVFDVVINHAWLGEQIPQTLGDGKRFGLNIRYSDESSGALETAGGIINALPLLCEALSSDSSNEPFLVINGDVFICPHLTNLPTLAADKLAHLWLVENPSHNLKGDFSLQGQQVVNLMDKSNATDASGAVCDESFTFSGIAMYRPEFFANHQVEKLPLAPMLRKAIEQGKVSGELLASRWTDVGTPQRLEQLNQQQLQIQKGNNS